MHGLQDSLLGKKTYYQTQYAPEILFAIPRQEKRVELGILSDLPFFGVDIWRAFEVSWLNSKGKPMVAIATVFFSCSSTFLIESKSFKLYLNSFNQTCFDSLKKVQFILQQDLSKASGAQVGVTLQQIESLEKDQFDNPEGLCLDHLDVDCLVYQPNPVYLAVKDDFVREKVYSHLLKSNCPVTGQPDWATVEIAYEGRQIQHEGLLQYFVSYREHDEFHEQCVERIFMDIMNRCHPEKLTVGAYYTRRGGLDINPIRSTLPISFPKKRFVRQ